MNSMFSGVVMDTLRSKGVRCDTISFEKHDWIEFDEFASPLEPVSN